MDPILERYQALEEKIKEYNPALDTQRLFSAFTYADNAHAGQLRKDGSPYITHPLAVAEIVAELELERELKKAEADASGLSAKLAEAIKDLHFVMAGGDPCKVCAKVCMMGEGNCQPVWTGEKTED